MLTLFYQWASCFNRPFNNPSEVGIFFVKSNLAGGNPRNIQQVIYQMRKLSYLTFNDILPRPRRTS
jgi:hypothetical protein